MPFDFNGDGRDDFIRQEKGAYAVDDILTAQVYLSNGNGTFSSQLLTDYTIMKGDLTNLIVADYNGDGRDDFIRQEKGAYAVDDILTAQVYLSNGNGTFSSQLLTDYTIMKGDLTNLIVADYNGDGRDDFIRQEKGAYAVDDILTAQVYLSNGNGTFSSQLLTDYTIMKGDFTNLIVGDYNGDGRDDFIRQEKGAYAVDDILTAQVYLSNGNGTFSSQLLTDYTIMKGDFTNLIVGDYNGDGRDDFIRQEKGAYAVDDILTAQVYLSNGNGTFSSQLLTDYTIMKGDLTNLIVGDYNGDGRDDFIRQEKGAYAVDDILTAQVYLSNGNGTFSSQLLTDYTIMKGDLTNLIVADYNGDGRDDFIRQEKGAYAVDDILTAQVYLSNGNGTFSSQLLTDYTIMKGDLVNIIA
ncbi:VCBS repeat-containing protein [Nostoc sphaeroides CHAB 2801]|uniref:FG-GAP repeat domain-containing protein n=1 Tax=Nostoc sphaeroides TaxID=446679 RepID=UPI000E5476DA|nr:VCBS repeat-containing protein [Nostoc sphaeroides]MCC5628557.1 VCBS repeat-containing protein [Nostoc sphaeroides CHAB 2801]